METELLLLLGLLLALARHPGWTCTVVTYMFDVGIVQKCRHPAGCLQKIGQFLAKISGVHLHARLKISTIASNSPKK